MPTVRTQQNRIDPDYYTIKQARANVFSKMKKGFITEPNTQDLIANDSPSAEYDEDIFTMVDTISQMTEQVSVLTDYYSGEVEVDKASVLTEISKLNTLISQYKTFFQLTFVNEIGSLSPQQRGQVKDVLDDLDDGVNEWSIQVQNLNIAGLFDVFGSPQKKQQRDTQQLINVANKTIQKIQVEITPLKKMLSSTYTTAPANYDIETADMEGSGRIEGSTLYGGGRTGVRHPHNQLSNSFRLHYLSSLSKRNM